MILIVLMALMIGIGTVLPVGAQMIYQNDFDPTPSRILSIFLRDVDRGIQAQLTPRYATNGFGKWSPDGQHIAYVSLIDTTYYVYLMDAQGGNKRPLDLQFTSLDAGYIWSPDSQNILFSATYEGISQNLVLNVATGETHVLPQPIGAGMWSPDSQNILYEASTENGTAHLYAMNIKCLDDAPSCLFHQLDLFEEQPMYDNFAWSPDGKAIVFSQEGQPDTQIMVATLRCADLKNVCVEKTTVMGQGPSVKAPIWSPDSKQVAYVYDTNTIRSVEVATGKTRSFHTPDILPILKDWSPDGRYIAYFSTQTGVFNVYLLDVISGQVRPLFPNQTMTELPEWRPISR